MGIPNPILYFTLNDLDHNSPISCLWTDFNNFFSLTLKFDGDSKSDIVLYLKWLIGPQKFVIMVRCKINFVMIWYSVIFAANLYSSIFVWSSDILNFVLMNVVILVLMRIQAIKLKIQKLPICVKSYSKTHVHSTTLT